MFSKRFKGEKSLLQLILMLLFIKKVDPGIITRLRLVFFKLFSACFFLSVFGSGHPNTEPLGICLILHIFAFNTAHFSINTAQSVPYCTLK